MCTVVSRKYKGHLHAVEVLNYWMTYKDHTSVSYVHLTGRGTYSRGYDNNTVAKHDVESYDTSLTFYAYTHFC